jgi:hypothetical protein
MSTGCLGDAPSTVDDDPLRRHHASASVPDLGSAAPDLASAPTDLASAPTDLASAPADLAHAPGDLAQQPFTGHAWYVDNAAAGGDGTSWSKAWASFAAINWSAIAPGDRLYISGGPSGGTKVYSETWSVGKSGVAGSPIWIGVDGATAAHNGTAVFDFTGKSGDGILCTRSYIHFDGNVFGERHLAIRNFVSSSKDSARAITAGGSPTTGVEVSFMSFQNVNNGVWLNSSGGVSEFSVHDNSFTGTRGDVVIGVAGSRGGFDASQVYNNYLEVIAGGGGGPDGIQLSSGVSVHHNQFKALPGAPAVGQHPDNL